MPPLGASAPEQDWTFDSNLVLTRTRTYSAGQIRLFQGTWIGTLEAPWPRRLETLSGA